MRDSDIPYTGRYEVFYDFDSYHGRYLKLRGYFNDGIRDGKFTSYYDNKRVESKEYYIDGALHDKAYYMFKNGYIKRKAEYNMGMLNGKPAYVDWYTNGQPREAGYYHNDILDTVIDYEKDVYSIMYGILPGERDSSISRTLFSSTDTLQPIILGLAPQKKPGSSREYFNSVDTIYITDYEIISIFVKLDEEKLISKSNIFTNEMKSALSDPEVNEFKMTIWLRNKDGIIWNLPGKKIYIN